MRLLRRLAFFQFVLLFEARGQIMQQAVVNGTPPTGCGNPTSGMQVWLRGSDISNVCTGGCSGTNVMTTLHDGSGNGNNAVNSSSTNTFSAAAINGLPAIQFSNTSAAVSTFTLTTPLAIHGTATYTIFAVLQIPDTTSNHPFMGGGGSSFIYGFNKSSTVHYQYWDNQGNNEIAHGTAVPTTSWTQINGTIIISTDTASGSSTFRLGEASDALTLTNPNVLNTNTGTIGSDGATTLFNGKLAELIIYNSGISTSTNEAYLHCRYGI